MSQGRTDFTTRHGAGYFSRAARLRLPPGEHLDPDRVRGYHLDLRAKAPADVPLLDGAPVGRGFVAVAQAGLGYHERWVAGEGEHHLENALQLGKHLLGQQEREAGPRFGGFAHAFPYRHGAILPPGWLSAMAQGQAASLFVRLALATDDDELARASVDALAPLGVAVEDGGVMGRLSGAPFPEEYPTVPHSHVLNGAIFALWGMADVAAGVEADPWRSRFRDGLETLAMSIWAWDIGYWTRYDLYPHRGLVNVSSSFYHVLHIDQLAALARITDDDRIGAAQAQFARQYSSSSKRARAFVRKAAFRLVVPRSPPKVEG
jgi:hypothetical protein